MKEYRLHKTENLLPLAVIKDSFKIYFHEMKKLLPVKGLFEKLEQVTTSQNERFVEKLVYTRRKKAITTRSI